MVTLAKAPLSLTVIAITGIAAPSARRPSLLTMAHKRFEIPGEPSEQTIARIEAAKADGRLPAAAAITGPDVENCVTVRIAGMPIPALHHLVYCWISDEYGAEVAAATIGPG